MGKPIEQGAGQPFRAKDLSPFLERQVRCHHRCTAFVALAEHFEEQLGAGLGQRHESQLMDGKAVSFQSITCFWGLGRFVHYPTELTPSGIPII